jgi:hypothetical protein
MKEMIGRIALKRRVFATLAIVALALPAFAEGGATVSVTPGENWKYRVIMGVIPVEKTPQCAAWIETSDGTYLRTLMVTDRVSRGAWRGNPKGGRPDSLPVWLHASARSDAVGASSEVDAATSATPDSDAPINVAASGLEAGKEYVARFEMNHSFDYNDAWPKSAKKGTTAWSGVNGQPSVVYEGRFVAGKAATVSLKPVGRGAVDGGNGDVTRDLSGLTSALSIVSAVTLTVSE